MSLRRRRTVALFRSALVGCVLAGILLTAAGPATVTSLLPYFTIQSNLAVGLLAGYAAVRAWQGRPDPPSAVKGAVTLSITITGLVFHLVLANPASPFAMDQPDRTAVDAAGNQFLHTVVPLLAVLDWAWNDKRGRLRWRHALWWLAFPLAYLAFALLRGLVVGSYPYPFVDAGQLGYDGVGLSTVGFAIVFWLLGLSLVGADRGLARLGRGTVTVGLAAGGPAPTTAVGGDGPAARTDRDPAVAGGATEGATPSSSR